jgi:hypothetical protein
LTFQEEGLVLLAEFRPKAICRYDKVLFDIQFHRIRRQKFPRPKASGQPMAGRKPG